MKKNHAPLLLGFLLFVLMVMPACSCRSGRDSGQPGTAPEGEPGAPPGQQEICFPESPQSTPSPDEITNFSADPEEDWIRGAEDARVTIVMFGDFQCAESALMASNLQAVGEQYPDEVRIVFRPFPQDSEFDNSLLATRAAEAAGRQDAFWEMHDLLFENQTEWSELPADDFEDWTEEKAQELDLNLSQFIADRDSEGLISKVEEAVQQAQEIGIPDPPYMRINNTYEAPPSLNFLPAFIEIILLDTRKEYECPPMTLDPGVEYRAVLKTEKGDITIKLLPEQAPVAVNSFLYLAGKDWYDGNTFHLVQPGFIAQTGDPTGTGFGTPGYIFGNEISEDLTFDRAGLVGTANSGPDSNGSQFFITYAAVPQLQGQHTIFGEVVEGMDVLEKLTPRNAQPGQDLPPGDVLLDVIIEEQ